MQTLDAMNLAGCLAIHGDERISSYGDTKQWVFLYSEIRNTGRSADKGQ